MEKLKYFIFENTWLPGTDHGWGNGYVLVPKDHPMYGKHYDEVNQHVNVHGGLTYSNSANSLDQHFENAMISQVGKLDGKYVAFGFDTAHGGDTLETWTKERVIEETKSLAEQLESISTQIEIEEPEVIGKGDYSVSVVMGEEAVIDFSSNYNTKTIKTYKFATDEEAEAFIGGIDAAIGGSDYMQVVWNENEGKYVDFFGE